jgi:serine/threonine-protein phosphatase 6 regulatory ankyrin repeat subunit B
MRIHKAIWTFVVIHVITNMIMFTVAQPDEKDPGTSYAEIPTSIEGMNEVDASGDTPLMKAAQMGALEAVKNYLKAKADVNMLNPQKKYNAIMLAAERGNYYTSIELVEAGADLMHRNRFGMTALHVAVASGHTEIARTMIDSKRISIDIPIEGSYNHGMTSLMIAAQRGDANTVNVFVAKGANVNALNRDKESALMYACIGGYVDIATELLSHGADLKAKNKLGLTALMLASSRGHADVIKALVHFHDANTTKLSQRIALSGLEEKDYAGRTALDIAFDVSKQGAMNELMAVGADTHGKRIRVDSWAEEQRRALLQPKR